MTSHKPALDVENIRADFPFTRRQVHGSPVVFLDSAASAQKPQVVLETMTEYLSTHYANVHRGVHLLSQESTTAFEQARQKVQTFLNAARVEEIVFTRSATEAINLVVQSWGQHNIAAGDAVIISEMEHHANLVPWQMLQEKVGFQIRVAPVTDDGALDMDAFAALLDTRVRMVAVTGMSNVLGTATPLAEIIEKTHNVGGRVLVDACQLAVHRAIDVQGLDVDFLAFSGHKLYGPTGIGVLYGKMDLLNDMPPWQGGGDMIEHVSFEKTTFAPPPARFEAGTPPFVEAIGLGAAIDYVTAIGWEAIEAHEADLLRYAMQKLSAIEGLTILGTYADKGGVLSMTMKDVHPDDMGVLLDRMGIAVRTGQHCAHPLMQRLGITGTTRASFGLYTTYDEIDRLSTGLEQVREMFA